MIKDRLKNWGRCVQGGIGGPRGAICVSIESKCPNWHSPTQPAQIEHLYASKLITDRERFNLYAALPKADPSKIWPKDLWDAFQVEEAWKLMTHEKYKKLLKWFYVKRRPQVWIMRRLRLKDDFSNSFLLSCNSIERILNLIENDAAKPLYSFMHNSITPRFDVLRYAA